MRVQRIHRSATPALRRDAIAHITSRRGSNETIFVDSDLFHLRLLTSHLYRYTEPSWRTHPVDLFCVQARLISSTQALGPNGIRRHGRGIRGPRDRSWWCDPWVCHPLIVGAKRLTGPAPSHDSVALVTKAEYCT